MKTIKEHKLIIVSVITVICLLASIAVVSYAAFSASITGTKVQYLADSDGSGYITMSGDLSANNNTNTTVGTEISNTFKVTATVKGKMKIGYNVSFSNVTTGCTPNVQVSKDSTDATIENSFGSYKALSATKFGSGTFNLNNASASHTYTIKMKCTADGTSSDSSNNTAYCSISTYTNESTCESNGGVWGTSQTKSQAGASGSYKVSVTASQVE